MNRWFVASLTFVAPVGSVNPALAAPEKIIKPSHWIVQSVFTDPRLNNSQRTTYNDDPRFLGRSITIGARRGEIDDGSGPCLTLSRGLTRISAARVLESQLPGQPGNANLRSISRKLGLQTGIVPITTYSCAGAVGGADGAVWSGLASFPLSGNRLALIYGREAVLVLGVDRGTIASAVACQGRTLSARTICADRGLAAWDRSVERAFAIRRDGNNDFVAADDPEALQRAQTNWQIERDKCGADRSCLRDRMSERVEALMQQG